MDIYVGWSIGFGGILFGILLVVVYTFFKNVRRKLLPGQESGGQVTLSQSYWEEHRQFQRVGITWSVSLETHEGEEKAKTKDIGLGGAFIICDNPLPLQEQFQLTLDIPEEKPLKLKAEVLWSNANVPDDKIVIRGMGIRFIKNKDEDREALNEAISAYLEENKGT